MVSTDKQADLGKVDASKLSMEALKRACDHYGIVVGTKAKPSHLAKALKEKFSEPAFANELADCDDCGGSSPESYDRECPYCGGSVDDEPGAASEKPAEKPAAPPADKPPPAVEKKAPKLAPLAPKKGDAVPRVAAGVTSQADAERLDADILEVHRLKEQAATGFWRLGRKLAEMVESKTWRARLGEDGTALYPTFDLFCSEVLGISSNTARDLVDVSKRFGEDDFARIGRGKLALILRVPEDRQPEILEAARGANGAAPASLREVKAMVAEAKAEIVEETGAEYRRGEAETGRKQRGAAGDFADAKGREEKKREVAPAQPRITIAQPLDKAHVVKLVVKKGREWVPATAKDLKEKPAGVWELPGTTDLYLSIHVNPTDGTLGVKCVYKKRSK